MAPSLKTAADVAEQARAVWRGRDRVVVVCAADYTDLALGLGETRLALSVFACSSAHMSRAHAQASRMGHEAAGHHVDGRVGEEFSRALGMVAQAWSSRPSWPYRFMALSGFELPGAQLGLVALQGDVGRKAPDAFGGAQELRRLFDMYGVESSEPSKTMVATAESRALGEPGKHPMFWSWVAAAIASRGRQDRADQGLRV
jgi:hypothetical protein